MQNFVNGTYRGYRLKLDAAGKSNGTYESYGEYDIVVVGVSKGGIPRVRVNGGRVGMVGGHSSGVQIIDGKKVKTSSSAYTYDSAYVNRYLCDGVTISADPAFLIKAL